MIRRDTPKPAIRGQREDWSALTDTEKRDVNAVTHHGEPIDGMSDRVRAYIRRHHSQETLS